jgi:threonine/homoserine/homoserine lactone efflux protein
VASRILSPFIKKAHLMSAQSFLALMAAHFLALLSPGPDFFLLLNHSLAHGARAGYKTARGIACANGIFILAALCGLRWLEQSPLLFGLMYWSGCAYLAWLSWQFWRAEPAKLQARTPDKHGEEPAFFIRGFASGLLNPKNALFYLTLFTVLAGKNSTASDRGLAGLWMFLVVWGWDCLVSWLVTRAHVLAIFNRQQKLMHRASACVMFGIMVAMVWKMYFV